MRIVFPTILVFVGMGILLSPLVYSFGEMMIRAELIARDGDTDHLVAIGANYVLTLAIVGIVIMTIGIIAGLAGRSQARHQVTDHRADGSAAG